jgi:hypothetical protein
MEIPQKNLTFQEEQEKNRTTRRRFIARTVELAATIPLIGLIFKNYQENRDYYGLDIKKALTIENNPVVEQFSKMPDSLGSALQELCDAYHSAYYKMKTRLVPSVGAKGRVHMHLQTYYVWEEPRDIPSHNVVYRWRDEHDSFAEKSKKLVNRPAIAIPSFDQVRVEKRQVDKASQVAIATGVYGTGIGALLGYEETIAYFKDNGDPSSSFSDKVARTNTPQQITRRSFFKVGASLLGAYVANLVEDENKRENKEGKKTLESRITQLQSEIDVSPKQAFERYFETNPDNVINHVDSYIRNSRDVLSHNINYERIRTAFMNVTKTGEVYHEALTELFNNGVPQELATATTQRYITEQLEDLASQKKNVAISGIFLEGLAIAGTMAAILVPAEIINKKLK